MLQYGAISKKTRAGFCCHDTMCVFFHQLNSKVLFWVCLSKHNNIVINHLSTSAHLLYAVFTIQLHSISTKQKLTNDNYNSTSKGKVDSRTFNQPCNSRSYSCQGFEFCPTPPPQKKIKLSRAVKEWSESRRSWWAAQILKLLLNFPVLH